MSRGKLSIGGACLAALIGASSIVFAQDPNRASPKDVIFARKTLMNSIAANMYPIDEMLQTGKIDLVVGHANADSISAMLMAFPHLFPNSTNLWNQNAARNPATDTLADRWGHLGEPLVFLQRRYGRVQVCVRSKPRAERIGFQKIRQRFAPDLRRLPLDLSA
jgi:hypothetical protein